MAKDRNGSGGRRTSGDELVFVALGGLGEIGMNVYLYGLGPEGRRQWLMVDLGLTFPGETEPGVDVVLPDLRFIHEERGALAGIVLTHAHEDHVGAVIDMWPQLEAPIYATPFTAGMVKSKLAEFGGKLKLPITEVPLGGRFKAGPFDIELVTLAHSIPEPSGLAIRTPGGKAHVATQAMCEIQILDDTHKDYAKLDPRQLNGSIYGMVAPHVGFLRPVGEWNFMEVTAKGHVLKIELNGTKIVDADVSQVTEFKDNTPHPGRERLNGHFGFAGHSDPVAFRNLAIRP